MKYRFRLIPNIGEIHRAGMAFSMAALTLFVLGASAACGSGTASSFAEAVSSVFSSSVSPEPESVSQIVEKWAEAVKSRDGKAQYGLLSTKGLKSKEHILDAERGKNGTKSHAGNSGTALFIGRPLS